MYYSKGYYPSKLYRNKKKLKMPKIIIIKKEESSFKLNPNYYFGNRKILSGTSLIDRRNN